MILFLFYQNEIDIVIDYDVFDFRVFIVTFCEVSVLNQGGIAYLPFTTVIVEVLEVHLSKVVYVLGFSFYLGFIGVFV